MKVPTWIVPVLIVLLTAIGLGSARLLAIPSVTLDLHSAGARAETETAVLLVDGVKCVDTAETAASNLTELDGVIRYVAFASHNRVEITYDPALTDLTALCQALEDPVYDEASGEFLFDLYTVIEIDGIPVSQ